MFAPYDFGVISRFWSCWLYSNVMLWARFIVLMLERASVDDTDQLSVVRPYPCVSLPEVFERLTLHVSPKHGQVCLRITLVSA